MCILCVFAMHLQAQDSTENIFCALSLSLSYSCRHEANRAG